MKVAVFDTRSYDREALVAANQAGAHELTFLEPRLTPQTAALAHGHAAVCSFVNDEVTAATIAALAEQGIVAIALRSAGYNHVDLVAAEHHGVAVMRVPEYSPHAVAEHAVALLLALDRKIHRAQVRVREWNFSLEGLVGFDLYQKVVGVIGTGRIGRAAARIFRGFGCEVLLFDAAPQPAFAAEIGAHYVALPELYRRARVITLHVPLTPQTHHMIDAAALAVMQVGVVLINTGRGALIDSRALVDALKTGHVGGAGLDVYEEEEGVFFEDLSDRVLQDDVLARLLTFPGVIITAHQAFLTREALDTIATVTLANLSAFERDGSVPNAVRAAAVLAPSAR